MSEGDDRRSAQRCVKDVGMHCSLLNQRADQMVTVRNFSQRGFYFESGWNIPPGALIILRTLDAQDETADDGRPRFEMHQSDPEACNTYRSHTLAKVQRCVPLDDYKVQPFFGVGAEVQIITD
jgi:hypothetical protein